MTGTAAASTIATTKSGETSALGAKEPQVHVRRDLDEFSGGDQLL